MKRVILTVLILGLPAMPVLATPQDESFATASAAQSIAAPLSLTDLAISTLMMGDTVMGDTATGVDNMDGANGFGNGASSGPEHVYALSWPGTAGNIELLFDHSLGDLDLYLWINASATGSPVGSASSTNNEFLFIADADLLPGTYYIVIDGFNGATNSYTLNITPEPTTLALFGLGAALASFRSRRKRSITSA